MARKRILLLSHVLPYPLDSGAKVRAYYVLRHLAKNHAVTLVSFVRPTDRADASGHLGRFCEQVHTVALRRSLVRDIASLLAGRATGRPALIVRDRSVEYERLVRSLLERNSYDAVHVDQVKTARHVEATDAAVPRLIDKHNVYHEMIEAMARLARGKVRAKLLAAEARAMARYERRVCSSFDQIVAVTDHDAQRLREMTDHSRPVTRIPICVDPDDWKVIEPGRRSNDIICSGAMFYPPNVDGVLWFLREVLPLVREHFGEVRVRIVGARPAREIVRTARSMPAVAVAGYVEDMADHLAASAVAVVPLRAASGMRVKILEAMARGVAVVSTRIGARGIAATDRKHIILADGPMEFARAVIELLRDEKLRRTIAENARRLIEQDYDWRRRYDEFDRVYERLFARRGDT